ncbi:MAG: aquaporin [Thermomicrobiales bacterium]|nr:aquaporin [Thermomicrobiales bacterium]
MNRKLLVEFIGAFFLISAAGMGGGFAAAAALALAIYGGAHISGGHYNPAVSLAMLMQKKLSPVEFGGYVVAQLLGGIAAGALVYTLLDTKFIPGAADGVSWGKAVLAEAVFTFLLVYTVCQVALPKKVDGNQYYGLAIGLTVVVGAMAVGNISGAALNSAVGIGPLLFDIANIGDHMSNVTLYLVGPLLGGAVASLVHTVVQGDDNN